MLYCLLSFSFATENSDTNLIINFLYAAYFGGKVSGHRGEILESLLGFGFHQHLGLFGVRHPISSKQARQEYVAVDVGSFGKTQSFYLPGHFHILSASVWTESSSLMQKALINFYPLKSVDACFMT